MTETARSRNVRSSRTYRTVKGLSLGLLGRVGVYGLARHRRRAAICALTFHDVLPGGFDIADPLNGLTVSVDDFAWQMDVVKRHYVPIGVDDLLEHLERGTPLPQRSILITFDDGHWNLIEYALPVLRNLGIPATAFVLTDRIGQAPEPTWVEDLYLRVLATRTAEVVTSTGVRLSLGSNEERASACGTLFGVLRTLREEPFRRELASILHQVTAEHQVLDIPRARFGSLDVDDCKRLASEGVSIQSHGKDHALLTTLDDSQVVDQLSTSRRALQQVLAKEVVAFAYPFGEPGVDFGEREERAVADAGYRIAFAASGGFIEPGSDRHSLPRIGIDAHIRREAYFQFVISGLRGQLQTLRSSG